MKTPVRTNFPSPTVPCSVIIEHMSMQGTAGKSNVYKKCKLSLARNEFREIVLQVDVGKTVFSYPVSNVNLHKRFLKEGKSTVHLQDLNINLMISNAPPNLLLALLRNLTTKLSLGGKASLSVRQRMLSSLHHTITEISPLTFKELESVKPAAVTQTDVQCGRDAIDAPFDSPVSSKRRRDDSKENRPPSLKVRRLLNPVKLTKEQSKVLQAVHTGKNIFFTGSAGTGKSFLLRHIVGALSPDVTFVTASTGVAACQVGGTTLHAFAGIGAGEAPLEQCIQLALRKEVAAQWKKCRHLIIDEISMVDGTFFSKLEKVAKAVRGSDRPFGGIQVILCGDFLQLPPVARNGAKRQFCFQSRAWGDCIQVVMELNEVKRQDDAHFIEILQNIRRGRCVDEHIKMLKATASNVVEKDGIMATQICTHREDVSQINENCLAALKGEKRVFMAVDSEGHLSSLLDVQTPVPVQLVLKKGAQVMLMKNLDIGQGMVNGARGVVVGFSEAAQGHPVVKFACGITSEIQYEKFAVRRSGGNILTRRQIPLQLAWAFSIHKSQGMTLDCVEMCLSKVFEAGQAYVALSRARNLKSLRIVNFNPVCIKAHPDVLHFYRSMNLREGTQS